MKRRPRPQADRRDVTGKATAPAPVRGLNARDSLAMMKPTDAIRLDNWICRTGYLEARKGRVATATGFADPVETLMSYVAVDGTTELFAAAGSGIFDATASGAIGAAVVSGLTSAYWNSVMFSNTGGNYLLACNGADDSRIYDGTTWATFGGTGLAVDEISQFGVWKRRLWAVERNSMSAWYLGTDAIAGAMTEFPFQGVFRRGGRLQAILNWSIDGGSGADDYFVAVTSEGEVAIYQGTDPTSAATFSLVGVFYVGAPIGERFYAQYGGDLLMLTAQGLIPLSKYLQSQTVDKSSVLSDRIQQLISADISAYGSTEGWELHVYFQENFLFIQVPAGTAAAYQYVMSTITGAWSRFLVNGARTWCTQDATLYMGDASQVYDAWSGGTDAGDPIPLLLIPAFSFFSEPTRQKKFSLGRVLFESDVVPRYRWQLLVDFSQSTNFAPLAPVPASGNLWDIAIWDANSWGSLSTYSRTWFALAGLGYSATMAVFAISTGETTRIISLDYVYEVGGLL